jgi:hypothetical protein
VPESEEGTVEWILANIDRENSKQVFIALKGGSFKGDLAGCAQPRQVWADHQQDGGTVGPGRKKRIDGAPAGA